MNRMPSPFQTEQMTLAQLFTSNRVFAFPAYQRPYRWSIEEAVTLLEDVANAADRREDGYFMGNLVLTPEEDGRYFVIDGRQRLTTLFMLIAALRDLETDTSRKVGLHSMIANSRKLAEASGSNWRMVFPPSELAIIEATIARPSRQKIDVENIHFVTERLGAMLEVSDAFRERLGKPPHESCLPRIEDITDYLLNQCEVLVLTARNAASGLRLFQVLNNRGLQLSEADLVKPDLLQSLPPDDQQNAARMWENMEDQLGSENFDTLLRSYIFIQSGDWVSPGQDFTDALKAIMMSRGPERFHFEDIPRYGNAFASIHWGEIAFEDPTRNPNALLTGLNYLGRTMGEWKEYLPVAMEIIARTDEDDPKLFKLIAALDRAFFVWFINATPESARRTVAWRMIEQLKAGEDPLAPGGTLTSQERELKKAFDRLTAPFPQFFRRSAMIKRVEIAHCLANGQPVPQMLEHSSAEHILPQNPRPGSQWLLDFTRRDLRECQDLLGNGVPLSRDLDKRLGNRDFALKRTGYLQAGADRTFLSVKDVCEHETWLPETIRERTEAIAAMLRGFWEGVDTMTIPPIEDLSSPSSDGRAES